MWHIHATLAAQKDSDIHLLGGWVGSRAKLNILQKRKISYTLASIKASHLGHLACSLVTIPTTITWFIAVIVQSLFTSLRLLPFGMWHPAPTCCCHLRGTRSHFCCPKDGGTRHFQNVGPYWSGNTLSNQRCLLSYFSMAWEPHISFRLV